MELLHCKWVSFHSCSIFKAPNNMTVTGLTCPGEARDVIHLSFEHDNDNDSNYKEHDSDK